MDSDTTIEGAGYRGVPNPDIRCSDRHLADAEDISLRLSFCVRRVVIRDLESSVRLVRELRLKLVLASVENGLIKSAPFNYVTVITSAKEKPPSHPIGGGGIYVAVMLVRRRLRRSQRRVAVGTIIQP